MFDSYLKERQRKLTFKKVLKPHKLELKDSISEKIIKTIVVIAFIVIIAIEIKFIINNLF